MSKLIFFLFDMRDLTRLVRRILQTVEFGVLLGAAGSLNLQNHFFHELVFPIAA